MKDVVILDGVRTAIGAFNGSLSGTPPTDLASAVAKEAISRSGIEPNQIQHSIFGHVINTEPKDMYMGRVAAINAGISEDAPGLTVNRLCGSGAQAIISAAQHIMLGDIDYALAGGAESMSRSPHSTQSIRTGAKMGDFSITDMMIGALSDPFGVGHMGVTAENVATEHNISRKQQDTFAVESQRRASVAIDKGHFKSQILPMEVKVRRNIVTFDTDEHIKSDTTMESLAKLRPAFKKEGSVTAGNASGINDGAGALVLASAESAELAGLKPRAKLLGYAVSGVRHEVMGIGPVSAVTILLNKLNMTSDQFDVIESNEAFAAQACAVNQELELNTDKVNPNGGAIALGHPIGATGAIISVKALYELERIGGKYGLITMCIGGGQGIALAIENLK
jgi:acetyl-CoA C-acetyltransferase